MEYTRIKTDELTDRVLREGALAAEREATWAEHEALRRRVATAKLDPNATLGITDDQGQVTGTITAKTFRKQGEEEAKRLRARANRKKARAEVSDEELAYVRLDFMLNQRIPQLEQEHLNHATRLHEREQTLAMSTADPDGPTDEERATLQGQIKGHKSMMADLDEMWAIAKADAEQVADAYPEVAEKLEAVDTPRTDTSSRPEPVTSVPEPDAEKNPVTLDAVKKAITDPSSVDMAPAGAKETKRPRS